MAGVIHDRPRRQLLPGDIQPLFQELAKGGNELVIMPVPLILANIDVELAAALPAEMHNAIIMTAGQASATNSPGAADGFLALLMSPVATAVFTSGSVRS